MDGTLLISTATTPKEWSVNLLVGNCRPQGRNQEIVSAKQSQWVGIICPFRVEIGLTILKIRVRQMLGCLTIDYAPALESL